MTPSLKLVNFHVAGRDELTRLCLEYSKIAFDVKRIDGEAFKSLKSTLPLGQLPILKTDNVVHHQSHAIARYAAKIAGLYPADPLEALAVDCVVDTIREVYEYSMNIIIVEKDEAKKEEKKNTLAKELLPKRMRYIESTFKAKYLLGDKISLADLAIFNYFSYWYKLLDLPKLPFATSLSEQVKDEPAIAASLDTKD